MIRRDADIWIAEHEQASRGRRVDQADRRTEDDRTGPLRTDQRPGHMGTALREQPVDQVAGAAAWQLRQAGAHQSQMVLLESRERAAQAVDGVSVYETSAEVFAPPAGPPQAARVRETSAEDSRATVIALPRAPGRPLDRLQAGAHADPPTVVQQHVEVLNVVRRRAPRQRMSAASVVADHSADRAPVVRRGIGAEGQA